MALLRMCRGRPDPVTDLTADRISTALTLSHGNVSEAARTLNVSRVTLYKWMKRYGITVTKRPETAASRDNEPALAAEFDAIVKALS